MPPSTGRSGRWRSCRFASRRTRRGGGSRAGWARSGSRPSKLQAYARKEGALRGVYLPFWTFDSVTETAYAGQRGDFYYVPVPVTRTVNGRTVTQTQMVQKVRWRPARGRVRRHFDDVLVLASQGLPRSMTEALEPWDLGAIKPYTPAYLAGFQAEAYAVDLEEGFAAADQRMQARIAADVRLDIGGDVQRIGAMDVRHLDRTFKHVLLPLWIGAFVYGAKSYRVCNQRRERPGRGRAALQRLEDRLRARGSARRAGARRVARRDARRSTSILKCSAACF